MPKTLDTTLHKDRLCYDHIQLREENMKRNKDKSRNFSHNYKLGFNPPLYRKQNKYFSANKNFSKSGTKPYVPATNVNKRVVVGGANATLIQIK